MAETAQRSQRGLTIKEFRAFYESRPDEEHWELINGIPIMMTPATKVHQRIGSNIEYLLLDALEIHNPALTAFQRVGVNISPDVDNYDPEPDVVVVDGPIKSVDDRYSDRFYLVAEVVSRSDRVSVDTKRNIYKLNAACKCILTVQQDRFEVRIDSRNSAGWTEILLSRPDDILDLPDFGLRCTVADLYRGTPLLPPRAAR